MEIPRFDPCSYQFLLQLEAGMESQFYVASLPAAHFQLGEEEEEEEKPAEAGGGGVGAVTTSTAVVRHYHFIIVGGEKIYYDAYTDETRGCRYTLRLLHLVHRAMEKQWKVLSWYNYGAAAMPAGATYLFAPKFMAVDEQHDCWWFRHSSPTMPQAVVGEEQQVPSLADQQTLFEELWVRHTSSDLELEYRGPSVPWPEAPPAQVPRNLIQTQDSCRWTFDVRTETLERRDRKLQLLRNKAGVHLSTETYHTQPPPEEQPNPLGRVRIDRRIDARPLTTIFYPPLGPVSAPFDPTGMTMTRCGLTRSNGAWPEFAFQCAAAADLTRFQRERMVLRTSGDRVQAREEEDIPMSSSSSLRHDRTWTWTLGPCNLGAGPLGVGDPDLYRCYRDEYEFVPNDLNKSRVDMILMAVRTTADQDGGTCSGSSSAQLFHPLCWKLWEQQVIVPPRAHLVDLARERDRLLKIRTRFDPHNCVYVCTTEGVRLIMERTAGGFLLYERRVPESWGAAYDKRWVPSTDLTSTEQRLNSADLQSFAGNLWTTTETEPVWLLRRWPAGARAGEVAMVGVRTAESIDQRRVDLSPFFNALRQAIVSPSGAHRGTS